MLKHHRTNLSREFLHQRHRLSHQQIDGWLGEESGKEYLPEKMEQMQKLGRFLQLTAEMHKQNLRFIILKGPLLSQRIYDDATCRRMRDYDILVKQEEVSSTVSFFLDRGFTFGGFQWPESEKRQKMAFYFLNQVVLHHLADNIIIEVHWKLFSDRLVSDMKVSRLIEENTGFTNLGGQEFRQFSIEFELLYLIIHGTTHAWFRLKWLLDIAELIKRGNPDREKFKHLAEKLKAERFVGVCHGVLKENFPEQSIFFIDFPIPKKITELALRQIEREAGDQKDTLSNTLTLIRYRLALSSKWRYKADVIRVLTFCAEDLEFKWVPPYRIFYYIFRPVGYILRKLKSSEIA